jgi:hypothetical protein
MTNEALVEQISRIAAQAAVEYLEKQKREEKKNRIDRRLRNTKLMIRNYKNFKRHCASIPEELKNLDNSFLMELDSNELAVESIKRSKVRTLTMVKFIEKMMAVYKVMCEQSEKEEDIRSYESIYKLYIADTRSTVKDIAKCQKTDERTVYRDVDKACKALSTLIFGIDSIDFYD